MHNTWVFVSTKLYIKASELYHNNAIIFGLAFFSLATLIAIRGRQQKCIEVVLKKKAFVLSE